MHRLTLVCFLLPVATACTGVGGKNAPGSDSGDPGASLDADGDGFTGNQGDCDDGDAGVHPDAVEICGDGIDENCDGSAAPCGIYGALTEDDADASLVFSGDQFASRGEVHGLGDLDGDGQNEVVLGDSSWTSAGGASHGGLLGIYEMTGAGFERVAAVEGNDPALNLGVYGKVVADIDGDGQDDLLLGSLAVPLLVVLGPITEDRVISRNGDDTWTADGWISELGRCDFGSNSIWKTGDPTGDGVADLAISDPYCHTDDDDWAGLVYVFAEGLVGEVGIQNASTVIEGQREAENMGTDVDIGDVDGDGVDDLLVTGEGAPYPDSRGVAGLFLGPLPQGTVRSSGGDAWFEGDGDGQLGRTGRLAGDLDGDGLGEIALWNDGGHYTTLEGNTWYIFSGASVGDLRAGDAWAMVGASGDNPTLDQDLNGDGVGDFVTTQSDGAHGPAVIYGPIPTGHHEVGALTSAWWEGSMDQVATFPGSPQATDLDADGIGDLVVWGHDKSCDCSLLLGFLGDSY
jgi:hypothetical protein